MHRLLLAVALALPLAGCPGSSKPQGTPPAQRTAEVERAQAQTRLDDLSAAKDREGEATAVRALKTWLSQPRQWRAEGYRVRLTGADGKALTRAALEALLAAQRDGGAKPEEAKPEEAKSSEPGPTAAAATLELKLEVPYFPPTVPSAKRAFLDPEALRPLLGVLLEE
ncbi:MAG: hypothetical protein AB7N76_01340 [Planctomycetota bacterium]